MSGNCIVRFCFDDGITDSGVFYQVLDSFYMGFGQKLNE